MNRLILTIVVCFSLFATLDAQFVRIWEKSVSLGNVPPWFSTTNNTERGIAYGTWNNIPRLYVISNRTSPRVIILNALTGDSVGSLNTAGIEGGLTALNDISTFYIQPYSDPKIFACNLTNNPASDPFKIYIWSDETAAPQILVVDSISTFRLGDHLNLYWQYLIYKFVVAASGTNKIVEYTSDNGNPPFVRGVVSLSDGILGANASAAFNEFYPQFFEGGYIVNSDGNQPRSYDTSGVLINISADTLISGLNNSIKFYANGTLCCDNPFYLTFNYDQNSAEMVMSIGQPYEVYYGMSPSLGSLPNPENYGDVEFSWRRIDSLYIFVLAGNNGIGAYYAPGLSIPVELSSFMGIQEGNQIRLDWKTATEKNNKGFEIQKKSCPSGGKKEESWSMIGFVDGSGTSTEVHNYTFEDGNIILGQNIYRLKQIDFDGNFTYSSEVVVNVDSLKEFSLAQNFPNPFNPATIIKFSVPEVSTVNLSIYNSLGELVEVLKNEVMRPGYYQVSFNASGLAAGVYFYRIKVGEFIKIKKMLYLK